MSNRRYMGTVARQVCPMYPTVDTIVGLANDPDEPRPVIMCEYAHAMGNSNGKYVHFPMYLDAKGSVFSRVPNKQCCGGQCSVAGIGFFFA